MVLGSARLDFFSLHSAFELEIKYIVSACCECFLRQNCPLNLELQEKFLNKQVDILIFKNQALQMLYLKYHVHETS